MKKLVIAAALGLMSTGAFAQVDKVKSAEKLIDSNTAEARKQAAEARQNDATKNDPYAWFVSGMVEQKDYNSELTKAQLQQKADENKMYNALIAEVPFFLQTYALENVPNEKGKIKLKYAKKAKDILKVDLPMLLNAGTFFQQKQDYKTAAEAFESYVNVRRHALFADDKAIATLDTTAYDVAYYSALMYHEVKNYDKAIAIANEFKDSPIKAEDIYQVLAASYQSKGDSVALQKTLEEGQKKFPKSAYFTLNLAQQAFNQGKYTESENYVLKALEQDPNNVALMSFVAGLSEQQQKFDKAAEWYKKAIAIKADDYDANFNLGRTYYNMAVELFNAEKPTKLSDEKGKGYLEQAIPYLEIAYKQKPDGVYYMLSNVYDRLGRKADYDRIMAAHK